MSVSVQAKGIQYMIYKLCTQILSSIYKNAGKVCIQLILYNGKLLKMTSKLGKNQTECNTYGQIFLGSCRERLSTPL